MATLDWIILAFLAIGAYSGYREGLFLSLLSIVAFFVAMLMAFQLMDWGAMYLAKHVDNLTFMLPFVAFLMIFLGVLISLRVLAFLVKKSLDITLLGTIDNVAGAFLGMFKTVFILSLLLWMAESFQFKVSEKWAKESTGYTYVQPIAPFTVGLLDNYTPIVSRTVASIRDLVKQAEDVVVD